MAFKFFKMRLTFVLGFLFINVVSFAQHTISGTVTDSQTGEPLIGATILYAENEGVVSDFDSQFTLKLQKGEYRFLVSYVGYKNFEKKITVDRNMELNVSLETTTLSEVEVIADIAIDRKTPIAFSTIPAKKIEEELADQDLPMLLNSTPGVYATQQGGGDGDARINIRGFNQRNVAVMIDGIPVNDMENGWVYWSNWFGLSSVTSNTQVQRGLGASKIAIPSVGGTMNIITKGISNKAGGMLKQSVGPNGYLKTSFGLNTGKSKSGWGLTLAGSYKQGDGWVDQNFTKGYFYYAKVQKSIGKHVISLSAMGAPQEHGQRKYKSSISTYDTEYALSLGADATGQPFLNKGLRYNKHWGWLNRWTINENGDTIHVEKEALNTAKNYYHKPQFSLRDFWAVNDKFHVSNIVYASIGTGGGTRLDGQTSSYDTDGQLNLQPLYDENTSFLDPLYSSTLHKSTSILKSSINNHYWYGFLSTLNYKLDDRTTLSGGIDARSYKGEHYQEVYDLLGGDYFIDEANQTQNSMIKVVGDKMGYDNDGLVRWYGGFGQIEYVDDRFSLFLNVSEATSMYKRIDYFKKKDLVLEDTTYNAALGTSVSTEIIYDEEGNLVGANKVMVEDTIIHQGVAYTLNSPEARTAETDWFKANGWTFKTGANYNIDDQHNVFANAGYISKAPRFSNVFDNNNELYRDIQNEFVKAIELGYSFRSSRFSLNANAYNTVWKNKPVNGGVTVLIDDTPYRANINGMDALHRGIEVDWALKLNPITIEWMSSLGDWTWTSQDTARFYDDEGNPVLNDNGNPEVVPFDARGVHVGDAAQTQFGLSIRWDITKNAWIKVRRSSYDKHYADFEPTSLEGETAQTESWILPKYNIYDLHAGHKIAINKLMSIRINFSILNLLNTTYISDAQNNDPYIAGGTDSFDATSAGVFFGMGRRYNASIKLNF